MERQRFPTALELITGKFLRHSEDFYQWRIKDRESRMQKGSPPEMFDDLAVAYEKLGNSDKAIEIMLQKGREYPGIYTTHANLGTFYIHAGRYREGITEIDKALEINPDAHFGRELYQKYLVEYLLSLEMDNPVQLPLCKDAEGGFRPVGFAAFLLRDQTEPTEEEIEAQMRDAAKGVMGMMKFGNFDSPILLEALGDLLISGGFSSDAKLLAARAYLKASYETEDSDAQKLYRQKANERLHFQTIGDGKTTPISLSTIESQLRTEIQEADDWYEALRSNEVAWIEQGINPEEEFQKKYYNDEPTVTSTTPEKSLSTNLKSNASEQARIISRTLGLSRITSKGSLFVIGGLLVCAAFYFVIRKPRQSNKNSD